MGDTTSALLGIESAPIVRGALCVSAALERAIADHSNGVVPRAADWSDLQL